MRQGSLKTRDRKEAERLVEAMRKASGASEQVNLALAQLYLRAANPDLASKTWQDLFEVWVGQGLAVSTRERRLRAIARTLDASIGKVPLE